MPYVFDCTLEILLSLFAIQNNLGAIAPTEKNLTFLGFVYTAALHAK